MSANTAASADQIGDLIKQLPGDDPKSSQAVCQKLLAGGSEMIARLVEMVGGQFGDSSGVQPKYALEGLAHYASRPGAKQDRKLLAESLAGQLGADHSDELKAFVVRQLQRCGREEEVAALAELLADDRLCDPAAQALTAIGGKAAQAALKSAQAGAGADRGTSIENALAQFPSENRTRGE